MKKKMILFIFICICLTGCKNKPTFTPLPKFPTSITITQYDSSYNLLKTVTLKGKKKNHLLSELNNAGKHIVPKNAVFHCPTFTDETIVYRDIVIHYEQPYSDRLFEMNTKGCTFLIDNKDGISLNPNPLPIIDDAFK